MYVYMYMMYMYCSLLYAVPEEFDYNPQTGKHGDRSQRMEIKRSSVEYIAPSEYMVSETQRDHGTIVGSII